MASEESHGDFKSEQERVDYLRSRGVDIDLIIRKDRDRVSVTSTSISKEKHPAINEQTKTPTETKTETTDNNEEFQTEEERLEWLRQRGVLIETAEERRALREATSAATATSSAETQIISYVLVPWDTSKPLQQCHATIDLDKSEDQLPRVLQSLFAWSHPQQSGHEAEAEADYLQLWKLQSQSPTQSTQQLLIGSDNAPIQVSDQALRAVAQQGCCETFRLVPPMKSNNFRAVNIYLDEIGMLKRLPLNSRAAEYAIRAGFNPPPKFYGDVVLGRVAHTPLQFVRNVNFHLGEDTDYNNKAWLHTATMENLEYQMSTNKLRGAGQAPTAVGEDGIAKEEGLYSWTQTPDDLEIVIPVSTTSSKDVKVSFHPRRIIVYVRGDDDVLSIELYAPIDTDGCTWTLDKGSNDSKLVLSCEKMDGGLSWPRITV